MALPSDWTDRLVAIADRVVLGTDFPNIPHPYSVLHDTPAKLLNL